mmetsp:Transcript_20811/g.52820  ORF Transcript_20811/g.52820 Transcript_20811/m.52820 type:complete len:265 (-) Transcript_20811:18-812(-)
MPLMRWRENARPANARSHLPLRLSLASVRIRRKSTRRSPTAGSRRRVIRACPNPENLRTGTQIFLETFAKLKSILMQRHTPRLRVRVSRTTRAGAGSVDCGSPLVEMWPEIFAGSITISQWDPQPFTSPRSLRDHPPLRDPQPVRDAQPLRDPRSLRNHPLLRDPQPFTSPRPLRDHPPSRDPQPLRNHRPIRTPSHTRESLVLLPPPPPSWEPSRSSRLYWPNLKLKAPTGELTRAQRCHPAIFVISRDGRRASRLRKQNIFS